MAIKLKNLFKVSTIKKILVAPFKWINNHQTEAQTYTNIIATIVTLGALLATIHFSDKNIQESERSNQNATAQLILSKKQFDLASSEIARNKAKELQEDQITFRKDAEQKRQKSFDSLRLHKLDSFQMKSFYAQNHINEQQLKAITKQAITAEAQFNMQSLQNADFYERNKAVFVPDSVITRDLRATLTTVSFRIVNVGNLNAHVDSTYIAVRNPTYLYFNDRISTTNADLIQTGYYLTSGIEVFKSYINLEDTYYCLLVYYYDTANKTEKAVPKFFRYAYNGKKQFFILPLLPEMINDFSNEIFKHSKYRRF